MIVLALLICAFVLHMPETDSGIVQPLVEAATSVEDLHQPPSVIEQTNRSQKQQTSRGLVDASAFLASLEIDQFKHLPLEHGTYLQMRGTYLGSVDLVAFYADPESAIENYVASLEPLTSLSGSDLDLQIAEPRSMANGNSRIRFNQVIDGIPIQTSFSVTVDPIGSVQDVSLMLFDASKVQKFSVSESAARQNALSTIADAHSAELAELRLAGLPASGSRGIPLEGSAEETYQIHHEAREGGPTASPQWDLQFFVYEPQEVSGVYRVTVDGVTGEARIRTEVIELQN